VRCRNSSTVREPFLKPSDFQGIALIFCGVPVSRLLALARRQNALPRQTPSITTLLDMSGLRAYMLLNKCFGRDLCPIVTESGKKPSIANVLRSSGITAPERYIAKPFFS
jgi:hypothetical protein